MAWKTMRLVWAYWSSTQKLVGCLTFAQLVALYAMNVNWYRLMIKGLVKMVKSEKRKD